MHPRKERASIWPIRLTISWTKSITLSKSTSRIPCSSMTSNSISDCTFSSRAYNPLRYFSSKKDSQDSLLSLTSPQISRILIILWCILPTTRSIRRVQILFKMRILKMMISDTSEVFHLFWKYTLNSNFEPSFILCSFYMTKDTMRRACLWRLDRLSSRRLYLPSLIWVICTEQASRKANRMRCASKSWGKNNFILIQG